MTASRANFFATPWSLSFVEKDDKDREIGVLSMSRLGNRFGLRQVLLVEPE